MGVCCIVFDIDGMLFEFFMNFLNIEKNKILRIFFSKFHVFFTFHAISNIKKKNKIGVKKIGGRWLNGRWFLQIVDGDIWNLYPLYPLFLCSDFVSQMWGGLGGGGCNIFLTFYAISSISRKKIWECKYKSAPSLAATG